MLYSAYKIGEGNGYDKGIASGKLECEHSHIQHTLRIKRDGKRNIEGIVLESKTAEDIKNIQIENKMPPTTILDQINAKQAGVDFCGQCGIYGRINIDYDRDTKIEIIEN